MKKKILATFALATFLLIFTVSHAPIQAEDNAVTDYEGFEGENFGNNVFLPLVGKDYEENITVIDFEGLAEGKIVRELSYGEGISGVEIEGEITVEGFNPNFGKEVNAAMIFDATCDEVCSGEDDDLYFPELGNGLIISEDLDPSDPDDAADPGDLYFEFKFDFSKIENAIVNVKKLTYGDIDDYEPPGLIEASKDTELKTVPLQITGNNRKKVAQVNANDIDSLVVRFYGSMMIDNIEIEVVPTTSFDVTIGYEDREFVPPKSDSGYNDLELALAQADFDYNDWVVRIWTEFVWDEDPKKIKTITFIIKPQARGGRLTHSFGIKIPPDTFESGGRYELSIKDNKSKDTILKPYEGIEFKKENSIDVPIIFDFTGEHKCDCEAFSDHSDHSDQVGKYHKEHNIRRAIEGNVDFNDPARRYAELSIEFDKPFQPDFPGYEEHCQGLFFDPYLDVAIPKKSGELKEEYRISWTNIDYTDPQDRKPEYRILCVPDPCWKWPEELTQINLAYTKVLGGPPYFDFQEGWYRQPNDLVFDEAEPCTIE